jgi:hypothetical protein
MFTLSFSQNPAWYWVKSIVWFSPSEIIEWFLKWAEFVIKRFSVSFCMVSCASCDKKQMDRFAFLYVRVLLEKYFSTFWRTNHVFILSINFKQNCVFSLSNFILLVFLEFLSVLPPCRTKNFINIFRLIFCVLKKFGNYRIGQCVRSFTR